MIFVIERVKPMLKMEKLLVASLFTFSPQCFEMDSSKESLTLNQTIIFQTGPNWKHLQMTK